MNYFCEFCDIFKNKNELVLFQNENIFIIQDLDSCKSKLHILVCPIKHLKDIHDLKKEDVTLLRELQEKTEQFLEEKFPNEKYRFGYHEPPRISVDHLHLHGFVLPIKDLVKNLSTYGYMLLQTEQIIKKLIK